MTGINVKVESEDESFSLMRKLSLHTHSTTVQTPIRAFHLKQDTTSESRLIQNNPLRGMNEIYHEFTKQKIDDIDNDVDKLNEWGKKLRYIFTLPKIKDELNFLFFTYENKDRKLEKPNTLPTDAEIEYLCNIVTHPASQIIIPPMIPNLSGTDYLKFLKKFFEFLNSYKKKQTIMGHVPMVATKDLREINQFYFENGINLFTIDFNGKYPMDSYLLIGEMRKLSTVIKKEFKIETYMHAFNVPLPKAQSTTDISPAKDILTFASGFDSYGTNHKRENKPPEVIEKIKNKIEQNRLEAKRKNIHYVPPFRLFNRKDYGYYKNDAIGLKVIFKDTKDNVIKFSDLTNSDYSETKLKGLRRAFNVEKQASEALEYHTHIDENSIQKYIQKKPYAMDNFERITRLIK